MISSNRTGAHAFLRKAVMATVLSAPGLWVIDSQACSEIILPVNGVQSPVVSARTLDFPIVDQNQIWDVTLKAFERGVEWESRFGLSSGKTWRNWYGFVGMTALEWIKKFPGIGGPYMLDGLNEYGLSAAFLWLDGSIYPRWTSGPEQLLWLDTVNYILGNFKTVAEVNNALTNSASPDFVKIGGVSISKWVPVHVIVHDSAGKSLLIEWVEGKQNIYWGDQIDKIGVLTNEPPWPDMLKELAKPEIKNANPKNEMTGLKADSGPISRFTKLAKLREFATLRNKDYLQVAVHLINNVDVVHGTDVTPDFGDDYTGPTLIRDHKQKKLYFKGQNNQSFRLIDLGEIRFDTAGLSKNAILADPKPGDAYYDKYRFSQDVTALLTAARLEWDGTESGPKVLSVTVSMSAEDLLKLPPDMRTGSMFTYAVTPYQEVYQWLSDGWTSVTDGSLSPVYTGALASETFMVDLERLPVSAENQFGTKIYAGYGVSSTEMFLADRQKLVFVIGDYEDFKNQED